LFDLWTHKDERFLASTIIGRDGIRYHMTVERLPARDWEWVAWRGDPAQQAVRRGVAQSSDVAASRATAARGRLERSRSTGPTPLTRT
jgi:hypothetical protein